MFDTPAHNIVNQEHETPNIPLDIISNTPAWLKAPPDGKFPSLPVSTLDQTLPFGELAWENFERLIKRTVERESTVTGCWNYGNPGQKQYGLDILAIENNSDTIISCYQCKRVKDFSGDDIKKSVDVFLKGKWADKAKKFVLCTSSSLTKTEQVDAISTQHIRLAELGITFNVWDGSEAGLLSQNLKKQPDIVDDFFQREWVRRFNGEHAANQLGEKLDGFELDKLRTQLHDVYSILFLRHDPGLRLGSQSPASLLKRYIAPALIETQSTQNTEGVKTSSSFDDGDQDTAENEIHSIRRLRTQTNLIQERRISVAEWFLRHNRSVVLGEPGFGKSTLMRVIALQLLSKSDYSVSTPWESMLPVWISFGGFSSAIQNQRSLSLEDYFDNWLHQNAADDIRPLFRRAARNGEIVLLIDGLDEGQEADAAKLAMDRISAFLAVRSMPAVFTSRPRGYERIRPDGNWPVTRLAAFDETQIEQFAKRWFDYLESPIKSGSRVCQENVLNRTKDFLKATQVNPRIIELARTPLFCQLLIDIFRFSHQLPEQRIKVYEKMIELLLSDHPAARFQAAGLAGQAAPRVEDMREMLMRLALQIQEEGGAGVITIEACQLSFCDFLTDDLYGPGLSIYEAKHQAKIIIDYALTGLGLMVERSPNELGFFHLTIQEYLAAQCMIRKDEEAQLSWLTRIWNQPVWREVALAWFSIRGTDQGKGATLRAIEHLKDRAASPWDKIQLLLLRTELASNDFGLPPREARLTIDEAAEQVVTTPYRTLRRVLAGYIAQGLRSPSVTTTCENYLTRWVPALPEWERAKLLRKLGNWKHDDSLRNCLKSALYDEFLSCRFAAAESIAKIFKSDIHFTEELVSKALTWPDLSIRTTALYCLWKCLPNHHALVEISEFASKSLSADLAYVGISIKVSKDILHDRDLDTLWKILANESLSYELIEPCINLVIDGWGNDERLKRLILTHINSTDRRSLYSWEKFFVILAKGWPGDAIVAAKLAEFIRKRAHALIRNNDLWDAIKTGFQCVTEIQEAFRFALEERRKKHPGFYWGRDTQNAYLLLRGETEKKELLDAFSDPNEKRGRLWICSTLMKGWSEDDDVISLVKSTLNKPMSESAILADWLYLIIEDEESKRKWLSEVLLHADEKDIFPALRILINEFNDEENLKLIKETIEKRIPPQQKSFFINRLIELYPEDKDVELWVSSSLERMGSYSLSSVAVSHESHPEVRIKLLNLASPIKADARSEIFRVIREQPIHPAVIQRVTKGVFAENDTQIRTSGIIARCIAGQQMPEFMPILLKELDTEFNFSDHYHDTYRIRAFTAKLFLGQYAECVDLLTDEKSDILHVINDYHENDILADRILFQNWDGLHKSAGDKSFEIKWDRFIHTGSAREAVVNDAARLKLIAYLKSLTSSEHSSASLALMAEMMPASNLLRKNLVEAIVDGQRNNSNGPSAEVQRIFAEQFGGNNEALQLLIDSWNENLSDESNLLPISYSLALGWPNSTYLVKLLNKELPSNFPFYTSLALCAVKLDPFLERHSIESIIKIALDSRWGAPAEYLHSLKKYSISYNGQRFLNKTLENEDYSLVIMALRLLNSSGKISDDERFNMISKFNELTRLLNPIPEGVDVFSGKIVSILQVIADEFLITSAG